MAEVCSEPQIIQDLYSSTTHFLVFIATPASIPSYLREKSLVSGSDTITVTEIPGSSSSLLLKIETPGQRYVLKQPLYLKPAEGGTASLKRAERETDCLRYLCKTLHTSFVPKVMHHDAENHLFIMQALPEDALCWQDQLLRQEIHAETAARVGGALGSLHQITYGSEDASQRFGDKTFFHELQLTSFYSSLTGMHPRLSEAIGSHATLLVTTNMCLLHGDFQPSNVILSEGHLMLLDWDMAHFGHPSFDPALMLAHLTLQTFRFREHKDSYLPLVTGFWNAYTHAAHFETSQWHERSVLPHLGCLLLAKLASEEILKDKATCERLQSVASSLILHEIPAMHVYLDLLSQV